MEAAPMAGDPKRGVVEGKIGKAFNSKCEAGAFLTPILVSGRGTMNTPTANSKSISQCPKQPAQVAACIQPVKVRNILVPIDFSAASEKALSYAVPLAMQFGAKITLLYVSQAQFYGVEFACLPIEESAVD